MTPTSLTFRGGEFSGPTDVKINGVQVRGVESITTEHRADEFSEVTIVLRYVRVEVQP